MSAIFSNKTALVTGGASGIGKAACLAFAREGAKVVIADRDEKNGIILQDQIKNAGGKALFIKTDVTSSENVKQLIDETLKAFNRLDFAFNNAGIESSFGGLTADYPEDQWLQIIQVNLTGVWFCMKFELLAMQNQKAGVIVNNSSALGLVGMKTASPYCAAKHGVIGLTQTAAIEYAAKGIRINAVCPGFVETPMIQRLGITGSEAALKAIINMHPAKRLAKPEEIAAAVIYLCRDEAAFINGSALVIDGGYLAR
jgi:NAD(P)-dependent dehydrogenase (short-subunit alcohol dehydrogenase family)